MSDLIDRRTAIDALRMCQTYLFYTHDPDPKISLESAEYEIEQLPSAQAELDTGLYTDGFADGYNARKSETISCKDCKWSDFFTTIDGRARCYCTENGAVWWEDDYCSRAEREEE